MTVGQVVAIRLMLSIFMLMLNLLVAISLARQCAQLWLKTRESLGHPLGIVSEPGNLVCPKELVQAAAKRVSFHTSITQLSVFCCILQQLS